MGEMETNGFFFVVSWFNRFSLNYHHLSDAKLNDNSKN